MSSAIFSPTKNISHIEVLWWVYCQILEDLVSLGSYHFLSHHQRGSQCISIHTTFGTCWISSSHPLFPWHQQTRHDFFGIHSPHFALSTNGSNMSVSHYQLFFSLVHWCHSDVTILTWKSSSLPCAITWYDYFWAMHSFLSSFSFSVSFCFTSCILFLFKFHDWDETGGGKSNNALRFFALW